MIAVVFISQRTSVDDNYGEINDQLEKLAEGLPGFIKVNSVREASGYGISISYWKSMEDARNWKQIPEHKVAQQAGKDKWYEWYEVQICEMVKSYRFEKEKK